MSFGNRVLIRGESADLFDVDTGEFVGVIDSRGRQQRVLAENPTIGAVEATIAMRTGTLASLRQLAGSAGEMSVATDATAAVLHTGVAGQARTLIHPWGVQLLDVTLVTSGRPVLSGTPYVLVNATEAFDPLGIYEPASGTVSIPLATLQLYRELTVVWQGAFEERTGGGTYRRIRLQPFVWGATPPMGSASWISAAFTAPIGPVGGFAPIANDSPFVAAWNVEQDQGAACNVSLRMQLWGMPL